MANGFYTSESPGRTIPGASGYLDTPARAAHVAPNPE